MDYLTPEEIAGQLRVDVSTVRRWLRSGRLKSIKLGRQYRIRKEDFEAFLKGLEVQGPKADGLATLATRPTIAAAL